MSIFTTPDRDWKRLKGSNWLIYSSSFFCTLSEPPEDEKALCFQKTMLDESSANAIDKSRAPTRHRNVKFPAAARDIQTPVGIIRAKNISMPGLKHCQMWGSLRAFIRLIFLSQLWLKRNLPFSNPIRMPRISARYVQIDWSSNVDTFLISTPPLNSSEIPPPYQTIAAVIINVRWETFIFFDCRPTDHTVTDVQCTILPSNFRKKHLKFLRTIDGPRLKRSASFSYCLIQLPALSSSLSTSLRSARCRSSSTSLAG